MKKLANIKFWSMLIAGFLCAFGGIYILATGAMSEKAGAMLILAAVIQFTLFYLLLFFWKKR